MAFVFAAAMNFFSYWFSDKIILKRYAASQVGPEDQSRLYRIVADLAQKADLPMPKVFVIPEKNPNAFATGRNPEHAAVAATEGILKLLKGQSELAAQIYAASLMAIEVDTSAEKTYLENLASGLGLPVEATRRIEEMVGLQPV